METPENGWQQKPIITKYKGREHERTHLNPPLLKSFEASKLPIFAQSMCKPTQKCADKLHTSYVRWCYLLAGNNITIESNTKKSLSEKKLFLRCGRAPAYIRTKSPVLCIKSSFVYFVFVVNTQHSIQNITVRVAIAMTHLPIHSKATLLQG